MLGLRPLGHRSLPPPVGPPSLFLIETTEDGGGAITTELSVTSFAGLNGANITCSDGNLITTETQDATALVFGKC